jgi:hypothetical protein
MSGRCRCQASEMSVCEAWEGKNGNSESSVA